MVRQHAMLLSRVGDMVCAFPVDSVVETMRPPAVEPLGRAAEPALAMIEGLAIIRGAPVAVVDLRRLLGAPAGPARRAVVVRIADRRLAAVVDDVIDVRRIDHAALTALPPLLGGAARDCVSAIAARDGQLLAVLDTARLVPEHSWRALAVHTTASRPANLS